ncbi:MAG TPA: winged helix-turn-helix transcriptional regulator [Candidatus Thermoplasmatota archaeon]|nr:winged helix-turn-helix transcriptional regulator [Candidatus Thermoplasmatota archaeon]
MHESEFELQPEPETVPEAVVPLVGPANSEEEVQEIEPIFRPDGTATRQRLASPPLIPGVLVIAVGAALWRLAAFFVPLFSRLRKHEVADHPVRAELLALILADPGIHTSELCLRSGLGSGHVRHHLSVLESYGFIARSNGGRYVCYYPSQESARRMHHRIKVVKTSRARFLLGLVRSRPGLSMVDVERMAGVARSRLDYHLRRLVAADLVKVHKEGGRRLLFPTQLAEPDFETAKSIVTSPTG